jgi:hypothetical protein
MSNNNRSQEIALKASELHVSLSRRLFPKEPGVQ